MKKRNVIILLAQTCAFCCAAVILWGVGYLFHRWQASNEKLQSDRNTLNVIGTEQTVAGQDETEPSDLGQEGTGAFVAGQGGTEPSDLNREESESMIQNTAWNLTLVNPWHILPESYSIYTVELIDGQSVDARCYPDLQEMMDDCRAAGLSPYICSSYRTWEKQNRLFENNVASLMAQGYSEAEARTETARNIAVPGTSEHQLGLAVDIVDKNYQELDEEQENTAVQQWLMENSWKYGWILRYPPEKSNMTGITYEPWHYRYVGKEAASVIYSEGICLEEYLENNSAMQN